MVASTLRSPCAESQNVRAAASRLKTERAAEMVVVPSETQSAKSC